MIDVEENIPEVQRALRLFHSDQLPFVTSLALNNTAKDLRTRMRERLPKIFTLRGSKAQRYARNQVRFDRENWATKKKPEARIRLENEKGGRRETSLFWKFEEGGTKTAHDREEPIAIPSEDIRSSAAPAPLSLYPKSLRLVPRRMVDGVMAAKTKVTRRGVKQWLGKRRTFILDPAHHRGVKTWGVYQREGPQDIRLLWTFKQKIPIPRRLGFAATAAKVHVEKFRGHFEKAWERAIRTARRR